MSHEDSKPSEDVIEKEISDFESFFLKLGNSELAKPERAILKTYLIWVDMGSPDGPPKGS